MKNWLFNVCTLTSEVVHPCWCSRYTQCLCLHLSSKHKTHAGNSEFVSQLLTNNGDVCMWYWQSWLYDRALWDWPDPSVLKSFLRNKLLKTINPDETIQFSQWVSTDRSKLVEEESEFDYFIEKLVWKFGKLTEHQNVAKKQSKFFKYLKENLEFGECIIVLHFAKNYSFLVQDAAQGFYWDNSKATIHPFVIYYVDGSGKLAHKSYVCVSDHKTHDTISVCSFFKLFMNTTSVSNFHLHKVFYFSDGSAAQYKNFKNLANLIFHQNNFHIQAKWNFLTHHMERILATKLVAPSKSCHQMLVFSVLFQTKFLPQSNYLIFLKSMLMGSPCFVWALRKLLVTP